MEENGIDREILESLRDDLVRGGGPTVFVAMVGRYLENIAGRLERLEQAVQRRDIEEAQQLAHSIKGISGYFGALGMATLAGRMEQQARAGALSEFAETLGSLQQEFVRVREVLERERQRDSSPP